MNKKKEWFGEWFDSPYYHILYKHRDEEEAKAFLDNILAYLNPEAGKKILDVACGKGRHCIYLNEKGFDVTGIDLSERSLDKAKKKAENDHLHFYQHDMRKVFRANYFDYVFNLFTSFGYFDTEAEHLDAIKAMAANLKVGGVLLLDFLNPYTVINKLVKEEEKHIGGIVFKINRKFTEDGYIVKNIAIFDQDQTYQFHEKVKAVRRIEFLDYFRQAGLLVQEVFGDYQLQAYQAEESARMIFLCKK